MVSRIVRVRLSAGHDQERGPSRCGDGPFQGYGLVGAYLTVTVTVAVAVIEASLESVPVTWKV